MRYMMLMISRMYQRPRLGRTDTVVALAVCSMCFAPRPFVLARVFADRACLTLPCYRIIGKARCDAASSPLPRAGREPAPGLDPGVVSEASGEGLPAS